MYLTANHSEDPTIRLKVTFARFVLFKIKRNLFMGCYVCVLRECETRTKSKKKNTKKLVLSVNSKINQSQWNAQKHLILETLDLH